MAYIVHRNPHFYVVAYDGVDPVTGRERRRWHSAGRSRGDAEAIAASLTVRSVLAAPAGLVTVGTFLADQWMPRRRTQLRPTTAHRYTWMIEHYICPRIGAIPLRRLRVDHLDQLYADLLAHGGHPGTALASKTVYDVHVIVRSALADATRRQLVDINVALLAQAPRSQPRARRGPETWTAFQLRAFLNSAQHLRLYTALHVASMTGMRRGELAGLRWGDWDRAGHRVSVARSRQSVAGRSVEVAVKTRTSRRCVDLDPATETVLAAWLTR
jgi:integrase